MLSDKYGLDKNKGKGVVVKARIKLHKHYQNNINIIELENVERVKFYGVFSLDEERQVTVNCWERRISFF